MADHAVIQTQAGTTRSDQPIPDTGLKSLLLIASVLGEQLDVARLRHEHIGPRQLASADNFARIALAEGLKARL